MNASPKPIIPPLPYYFCRAACRVITSVLFDLKVYGKEYIPAAGGALLLANHQSYLDPAVIGVQIRRPLSFLAKSELFDVPGFGPLIRRLNAFPVRQGAGDIQAVRETIKRLQEGHILTIFPEGSRTLTGELQPLQSGFALIVRKAEVPIVPVAIEGTFKAWRRGTPIFTSSPVRVKFGPAMDVRGLKAGEVIAIVQDTLQKLIAELREQIAEERH